MELRIRLSPKMRDLHTALEQALRVRSAIAIGWPTFAVYRAWPCDLSDGSPVGYRDGG